MEHKKTKRGYYEKTLTTCIVNDNGIKKRVTGLSKVSYEEACKDAERKKQEEERLYKISVLDKKKSNTEPFKHYILMFMEYRFKDASSKNRWTASSYSTNMDIYNGKFANSKIGNMQLKNLNIKCFQEFYDDLTLKQGLSITYVKNIRLLASQTLDYINRNICSIENYSKLAGLNSVYVDEISLDYEGIIDEEKGQVLSEEEILKIYNLVKEEPTRYMYGYCYLLQLSTGCRPQEILALAKNAINFEEGTIKINKAIGCRRNGTKKELYLKVTKNRVERKLYMDDIMLECIEGLKKFMPRHLSRDYDDTLIQQGLLVYNSKGGFVDVDVYTGEFKRLCTYLGITLDYGEGTYCLRHTYVSYNNYSTNPIQVLITAKNAGHSPKVDLETYTHLSEKVIRENTTNPINLATNLENSETNEPMVKNETINYEKMNNDYEEFLQFKEFLRWRKLQAKS